MKIVKNIIITICILSLILGSISIDPYVWILSNGIINIYNYGYFVFFPFIFSCIMVMIYCVIKIYELKD